MVAVEVKDWHRRYSPTRNGILSNHVAWSRPAGLTERVHFATLTIDTLHCQHILVCRNAGCAPPCVDRVPSRGFI
jgi:hypothetical protein